MQMTGEQRIAAPRAKVWAALNDAQTLKACIPGCQSLEQNSPEQMSAVVAVKVGPLTARFTGQVTLSDLDPPSGYRIQGEGQGGAAGFAKGGASVRLAEDGPDATILTYQVDAQVGGKLSQLGGAIIDATARQMAGMFFKRLSDAVAGGGVSAATPQAVAPTPALVPTAGVARPAGGGSLPWPGLLALLAALAMGFLLGRSASGWDGQGAFAGLAVGLLVVLTAAGAFAYGRRSAQAPGPGGDA